MSLQVDKAKWEIYESTLLFPKQLDFFKKRSFDSKELGAGSESGWEARAVGERKGGDDGCLASCAPEKPPLCTANMALDPSRRTPGTVSSGNTGRCAF